MARKKQLDFPAEASVHPAMAGDRSRHDHYRDLTHRLFATATAMLEDATDEAVAGQSTGRTSTELANNGWRLELAARQIATVAEAAIVVAKLAHEREQRDRAKHRR